VVRHCWSNESYYPALATIASLSCSLSVHALCTPRNAGTPPRSSCTAASLFRRPCFVYSCVVDDAIFWPIRGGRLMSFRWFQFGGLAEGRAGVGKRVVSQLEMVKGERG
jgi:hypothetical protein